VPPSPQIPGGSPPSTYAIASMLNREPGAVGRVAALTIQRAIWIGLGLYLAGIRGSRVKRGALFASATLTTVIAAGFIRKGRTQ
jgi:hypothetical protein